MTKRNDAMRLKIAKHGDFQCWEANNPKELVMVDKNELTVRQLKQFLSDIPDDAYVCIGDPDSDGCDSVFGVLCVTSCGEGCHVEIVLNREHMYHD